MPGEGSDPEMWIKILGNIMDRKLPVDTYVPGHGPVHLGAARRTWKKRNATSLRCETRSLP